MEKEKPPIFGLIQRGGQIALHVLENVRKKTIEPIIKSGIALGTLVHTDEYCIYSSISLWGYIHKTVCHGKGEYARDEDRDGFCEIHVNTIEGAWSLLRSWLRPHRGISQEKLPIYVGFFEYIYNTKKRGKSLLSSLVELLVKP